MRLLPFRLNISFLTAKVAIVKAMWKSAIVGRIQLFATYNKADKRKSNKTMERAATTYGKLYSADLEDV